LLSSLPYLRDNITVNLLKNSQHGMLTIACRDAGVPDCDYVAKGETEEDLMKDAGQHAVRDHILISSIKSNDPQQIINFASILLEQKDRVIGL
jgi:predicted small metal-binding protein